MRGATGVGLSDLQQGGPSVVTSLVSGSWEREVILRDLGRRFSPLPVQSSAGESE